MPGDLRAEVHDLRRRLAQSEAEVVKLSAQLNTVVSVLGPIDQPLGLAVQELLNYATLTSRVHRDFEDSIRRLCASSDLEARAIGNSMDASFRAVPVPRSATRR